MDYYVDAVIKRAERLVDAGDLQSLDQGLMLLGRGIERCAVAVEKGKRRKKIKAAGTATDTWPLAADDESEDGVGKRLDNIEEAFDHLIEKLGKTSGQLHKLGPKPASAIYRDSEDKAQLASRARVKEEVRRHAQQVGKTWQEAVSDEIRKFGVTPEIAAVRVINAYGSNLPHQDFAKSADIDARWEDAVTEIAKRDGVDRCEALRRLRHEQPKLYRTLQASS